MRLEGAPPFSRRFALKRTGLRTGDWIDQHTAQAAAERLRRSCQQRYYPLAQVSWEAFLADDGESLDLVFHINPGQRGRLRDIQFEGANALPPDHLRGGLNGIPQAGWWARITGRDAFFPDVLHQDQMTILRHYLQNGFQEIRVGDARLAWDELLEGYRVTWPILHEGPPYAIGRIQWDADVQLPYHILDRVLTIQSGTAYSPDQLSTVVTALQEAYQREGHAFADVATEVTIHPQTARADIRIQVQAGGIPALRSIQTAGNTVTDERVIHRELLHPYGQPYDAAALSGATTRIAALPMFSAAAISLQGGRDDPYFDVICHVQEQKSGRFEVGYAYGTVERGSFQAQLSDHNLSLRPPFRGQALQGNIDLTWGSRIVRVQAGLGNPRFRDTHWSVEGRAHYEDNQYISPFYSQQTIGGDLLAGHPIGNAQRVVSGYELSNIRLQNIDEDGEALVGDQESDIRLASLLVSWQLNRVDRAFRPTRGLRLAAHQRLGHRALGGNINLAQTKLEGSIFFNPIGQHVTHVRGEIQSLVPYSGTSDLPLTLRLYRGGANDLRGFEYRSISPVDDNGNPVGGQSGWWAILEHLVPARDWIDLALYVEAGDVGEDSFDFTGGGPAANYGMGLLVRAQNFPARFDVAFPFALVDGDRINETGKARISFSVGYRY